MYCTLVFERGGGWTIEAESYSGDPDRHPDQLCWRIVAQ